ncbi:YtxH domain-containing protein [Niabella aquatica]
MKNKDKILLGILGAAAAGVAIGLLFYTEEGKKTRKRIKNTTNDWADSLGSLIESGKENLSDLSQKAKEKLKKVKSKSQDAYSDLTDEYENKLS